MVRRPEVVCDVSYNAAYLMIIGGIHEPAHRENFVDLRLEVPRLRAPIRPRMIAGIPPGRAPWTPGTVLSGRRDDERGPEE